MKLTRRVNNRINSDRQVRYALLPTGYTEESQCKSRILNSESVAFPAGFVLGTILWARASAAAARVNIEWGQAVHSSLAQ